MAISLVQKMQNQTAGTSTQLIFPQATTAGNLLVIMGIVPTGNTPTVTDDMSNTYTVITNSTAVDSDLGYTLYIWYCLPCLAGARTVQGPTGILGITSFEFSGVGALDDSQHIDLTGSASSCQSPVLTPAHANELFVSWIQNDFMTNPGVGSPWTSYNFQGYAYGIPNYLIAAGSSTQQAVESPTTVDQYTSNGASFSPSGGGGGPTGAQKSGMNLVI